MTKDVYVVRRHEIESYEGLDKTHFLNPNARRVNKSLGDLTGLTGIGFHLIEVPPGMESTECHVHYHEDECVYVLEGDAEVTLGDKKVMIGPGDFVGYRAGGLAHTMKNVGDTLLKCLVAGQRLDHDVADYPNQGKRLFRNAGQLWNLVNIGDIENPKAGRKS